MLTNVGILWTFWLHRAYFSKKKKQTSMENENGWRENVFCIMFTQNQSVITVVL